MWEKKWRTVLKEGSCEEACVRACVRNSPRVKQDAVLLARAEVGMKWLVMFSALGKEKRGGGRKGVERGEGWEGGSRKGWWEGK